ncbi:MAG: DUF177 domain-containing protein [Balneolales bacterium]|nr:DUF177 domain-containing protein [Balneolales bacterium]
MLEFKINEIPKGKSSTTRVFKPEDLHVEGVSFDELQLAVDFEKREAVLVVDFRISGQVELVCDRSLDKFWSPVSGNYTILFKEAADFESEDEQTAVRRLDISGNIINIDTEVRDTVMLSVPVRKIHPRYFDENGELIEFEHRVEEPSTMDPRWEALKVLKENTSNN